jgi:phosphoglucosamine mutase
MFKFGTDGIRGRANRELTMEVGYWLGVSIGEVLGCGSCAIGRDTRHSGHWLATAVGLGLAAIGVEVLDCGVMPTGGLSWVARTNALPTVVVSASHNPYWDNGIKVFDSNGAKLDETVEGQIEQALAGHLESRNTVSYGDLGGYRQLQPSAAYIDWLLSAWGHGRSGNIKVAIDAANGAAASIAVALMDRLGVEVVGGIGLEPNGYNINDRVGALHPEALVDLVKANGAEVGLAFDGDADRLIAVSASGRIIDGDDLMILIGLDLARKKRLPGPGVVVTVMSNLGIEQAMANHGIAVQRSQVGDRQVAKLLTETGFGLGGEQSGHIIVPELSPTGDGLLTAVLALDAIVELGKDIDSWLDQVFVKFPQVHRQVPSEHARELASEPKVVGTVDSVIQKLGKEGRVVFRPSGTEPVVRIMVEAPTVSEALRYADEIESACREAAALL